MDPDTLMVMLGDISIKLDTVINTLSEIEINTSSTASDTSSIYSYTRDLSNIRKEVEAINEALKE